MKLQPLLDLIWLRVENPLTTMVPPGFTVIEDQEGRALNFTVSTGEETAPYYLFLATRT
jgi:hypothetical protein